MRFNIIILFLIISSCTKYSDDLICDCPQVTSEAINNFTLYAPEGFEYKKLKIELVGSIRGGAQGLTKHNKHMILLDTTSGQWNTDKNVLIYHELGHYLLGRGHDSKGDTIISNIVTPKSVMNINVQFRINTDEQLEYYMNELFN